MSKIEIVLTTTREKSGPYRGDRETNTDMVLDAGLAKLG